MRKISFLISLLCLLITPALAHAQTVSLAWDYDKPLTEVQGYTQAVLIDNTAISAAPTCTEPTSGKTTCVVAAPALATGTHDVRIQAQKNGIVSEVHISALNVQGQAPASPTGTRVKITIEIQTGS